MDAARPARVGASNRARNGSSTPSTSRTRETTWVASSEWPPSSKKLSPGAMAGAGTLSNADQTPASSSSAGLRSLDRSASCRSATGGGNARRSTLPFGVRGRAGSSTSTAGTMYWGNRWRKALRTASRSVSKCKARYATRRLSPGTSSHTTTAHSRTAGWALSTASISPSSMRKPRIFT